MNTISTTKIWDNQKFDTIIDVRSPSEFNEDHIPGAVNLPVLDDIERKKIGIIYKKNSPFEAKVLGSSLIAKNISEYLIKDLRKKLEQAMTATDGFGRDARSIMNTLGNIKDPEQVTDSLKENPEKIKVLK